MPLRNVLVINSGSSSLKFALLEESGLQFVVSGQAERLGSPEAVLNWQHADARHSVSLHGGDHRSALAELLPMVSEAAAGRLHGIGHRVVHGGKYFTHACRLDADAVAKIREVAPLAPLHNPPSLQGIEAALALYPELPQCAVFDTAFHQTLPEYAFRYALPESLYSEHDVRRYGFHGTSYRYVSRRAAEIAGLAVEDSCWLVAHLGNGSSTCAVVNGHSRDTSMGLTPLEGLVMGTRSGDVDPNLHGHLARSLGWSLEEIERVLNEDSGLLGLSGLSNDMRTLEQASAGGHAGATLAIEVYAYRLAKSLAAMSCALPRLDGLVFTGGIGENSALIRRKAVDHLVLFGLKLDDEANARAVGGVEAQIHAEGYHYALVVPTDEVRQIASETLALLD